MHESTLDIERSAFQWTACASTNEKCNKYVKGGVCVLAFVVGFVLQTWYVNYAFELQVNFVGHKVKMCFSQTLSIYIQIDSKKFGRRNCKSFKRMNTICLSLFARQSPSQRLHIDRLNEAKGLFARNFVTIPMCNIHIRQLQRQHSLIRKKFVDFFFFCTRAQDKKHTHDRRNSASKQKRLQNCKR